MPLQQKRLPKNLVSFLMGKIGGSSWLKVVKRAFGSPVKDKDKSGKKSSKRREEQDQEAEEEEKKRGKRRWIFLKPLSNETTVLEHKEAIRTTVSLTSNASSNNLLGGGRDLSDAMSHQQCALAVAMATKVAAEAAVATAQAAAELIRLAIPPPTKQEQLSAILIQTAFRGYLARRALGALKGLVQLQALVRGHNVRKRAKMTLQCIQSLIRLQAQACDQRKRLSTEGCDSLARAKKCNSINVGTSDNDDDDQYTGKTRDQLQMPTDWVSSKPQMSLYQAFSQSEQMWKDGEAQISANAEHPEGYYECFDRRRRRCKQQQKKNIRRASYDDTESIKIVEIDTVRPYTNSCCTPQAHQNHQQAEDYQRRRSSSYSAASPLHRIQNLSIQPPPPPSPGRLKPLATQSATASPRVQGKERCILTSHHKTSFSKSNLFDTAAATTVSCGNSAAPKRQPTYMAATVSAHARARSLISTPPRQRSSTPDQPQSQRKGILTKKRLSLTGSESQSDAEQSRLSCPCCCMDNNSHFQGQHQMSYMSS